MTTGVAVGQSRLINPLRVVQIMRLLIADDHPLLTAGLRAALRDTSCEIVGSAPDGAALLELIPRLRPDIVLTDLRMPGLSGLDILRTLRSRGDGRKVVLLTGSLDPDQAREAIELGVNGIVLKENGCTDLLTCLNAVSRGERWIDREVMQQVLDASLAGAREDRNLRSLTQREQTIARLVARGLSNKLIASQLGLTEGTVKVNLSRIYEKLAVTNRTELALLARDGSVPVRRPGRSGPNYV